jgi:VanZ family protein
VRTAGVGVALLVLAGIAYLSLARAWDPDLPGPIDQLPHAVAYAVLTAALLAVVLPRSSPETARVGAIVLGLSLIILGSLMELAQAVVGRDVEGADAVANAIGVGAALAVWFAFQRGRTRSAQADSGTSPARDEPEP